MKVHISLPQTWRQRHLSLRPRLPQLEAENRSAEVVGMFFFDDNTGHAAQKGDPVGERLAKIAAEKNILLMACDQCALRGLAEGRV